MVEIINQTYEPADLKRLGVKEINVVIPAHNSGNRILGVLANLAGQQLPDETLLNVFVCANACTDQTAQNARDGLKKLSEKRPNSQTQLIETTIPGQANALNQLVKAAGFPEIVVEVQDDVFPTKRALGILVAAISDRPDLGAIGLVNMPIPEYKRKNASVWEKIAYKLRTGEFNYSQKGLVDRTAAFRPEVVGKFPDVVAVDNFMALRCQKGMGYGIIQPDLAKVFYRLPKNLHDLLRQQDMYTKCTEQMNGWREENEDNDTSRRGNTMLKKSRKVFRKLKRIMANGELTNIEKLEIASVFLYTVSISRIKSKVDPYKSSKRDRIRSSV